MTCRVKFCFRSIIYVTLLCCIIVHCIDIKQWNYVKADNGICEQYIQNSSANIKSKFQCASSCEVTLSKFCIGFCFEESSSICTTYSIAKFFNGGTIIRNYVGYKFFTTEKNFIDAHTDCLNNQAGLILPKDSETNAFLTTLLTGSSSWLRASDLISEGTFVDQITGTIISYSNFANGQPNNYLNQDCLSLKSSELWFDDSCSLNYPYICQTPSLEHCPQAPMGNQEPPSQICYLKI